MVNRRTLTFSTGKQLDAAAAHVHSSSSSAKSNSRGFSVQDIRPTFLVARLFGLAPYAIGGGRVRLSKAATLYSLPCSALYLYALYSRLDFYSRGDRLDAQFRVLSAARTTLTVISLLGHSGVCLFWDKPFQRALDCLRSYDLAVKYDVESNAKLLLKYSWALYSFMFTYYTAIGLLAYYNEPEGIVAAVIYVYLYLPLSIAVMKFVVLITSILLRFRHLNRMMYPGFLSITMALDNEPNRLLRLRDVCWLHSCLCAAAANVNSLYSLQLLLWFGNLTLNTISRINDFGRPQSAVDVFMLARDAGLVLVFATLLCLVAGVCHLTSQQANKVGAVVFSPSSRYFRSGAERQDNEDKLCAGQYFALHPLHFNAASGLFQINLSLLLKIAGAVTTYLVILKSPSNCRQIP